MSCSSRWSLARARRASQPTRDATWLYLVGSLVLAAVAIAGGIKFKRFAFVAYGTIYGYIGISIEILRNSTMDSTFALTYLIVSGLSVLGFMVFVARLFGREE